MPPFILAVAAVIVSATKPAPEAPPVVVELFTSQSCSSCPPAEAYFRELAANKKLVALEWHVDYWDRLHHGNSGKWKDPFSSPKHTARQRAYNVQLRGRGSVYTPQAIVNGASEAVGSNRSKIRSLIKNQRTPATLSASRFQDNISFKAPDPDKMPAGYKAILVTFKKTATTRVGGGENHGKELREANIVTDFQVLKPIRANSANYQTKMPPKGFGCALLLQEKDGGPILAASYCPA